MSDAPGVAAAPAVAAQKDAPVPARRRSGGTLGDMARTVIVLGLAVFAIVFVAKDRKDDNPVKRVDSDVSLTVTQAARVAPFTLLSPAGLPPTWAPTSVSYGAATAADGTALPGARPVFHVGYVTPSGSFADLEESDAGVGQALSAYSGKNSVPQGQIKIGGRSVALAVAGDGSVTLTETVAANGKTTYVGVTGGASQSQLTQLLTSLQLAR